MAEMLTGILEAAGFKRLIRDQAVYVAHNDQGGWCYVPTHVDDLFVLFNGQGKALRDKVWDELMKTVKVKNEGTVHWALKTLIKRDPDAGILKISQGQYAREAVQRFGLCGSPGRTNTSI